MIGSTDDTILDRFEMTVLLTAQGIPFIRSGEEIMQDKQGEPNSYKSPDSINRIDWSLKAKKPGGIRLYQRVDRTP